MQVHNYQKRRRVISCKKVSLSKYITYNIAIMFKYTCFSLLLLQSLCLPCAHLFTALLKEQALLAESGDSSTAVTLR